MVVATPEKLLLKVLWEVRSANGRPAEMSFRELAERLRDIQGAGIPVYASSEIEDLAEALAEDVETLESLGFVTRPRTDMAELTGAGEIFASSLEYPAWVSQRLAAANARGR